MTGREFLNAVSNGRVDVLQQLLDLLNETGANYCVIGGLAVNAYAEPVVSLDLDVVIHIGATGAFLSAAEKYFTINQFPHSVNLTSSQSDLRIQIQTDARYQPFIARASIREVLGYEMNVASVEDVLRGKVWAYSDTQRRKSKRQKDLADIVRLVEEHPPLRDTLPGEIKSLC